MLFQRNGNRLGSRKFPTVTNEESTPIKSVKQKDQSCGWAPPVAQRAKNPPAMQETWVQSLGQEDPLEEGMATHSNILENPH